MKSRLVVLAAASLALAVSASAARAQRPQGPGRPGGGPGRRMQMMFEGITLTSEQQARVDSIVASFRAQMPQFTPGAPPDPGAMAQRRELMARQDSSIRSVLTPEQQQVFDRNVEGMRAMFPQRPPGPPSRSGRSTPSISPRRSCSTSAWETSPSSRSTSASAPTRRRWGCASDPSRPRRADALSAAKPDNIFLMKLSYWVGS